METAAVGKHEQKLLKRRAEIRPVLEHLRETSNAVAGDYPRDGLDRAWEENEGRTIDSLTKCYQRELADIERALSGIALGRYGLCVACHEPIDRNRLESAPETEYCAECKNFREAFEHP